MWEVAATRLEMFIIDNSGAVRGTYTFKLIFESIVKLTTYRFIY